MVTRVFMSGNNLKQGVNTINLFIIFTPEKICIDTAMKDSRYFLVGILNSIQFQE